MKTKTKRPFEILLVWSLFFILLGPAVTRAVADPLCEQGSELAPDDGQLWDYAGFLLSVDGDWTAVGSRNGENGYWAGATYMFRRECDTWTQMQKVMPSDGEAQDQFGLFIGLSGDTLAAGALGDDDNGVDAGAVYVFENQGGTWTQVDKLLGPAPGDGLGRAVALDGDTLLATGASGVLVFTRDGGSWTEQAQLTPGDGPVVNFGYRLSLDGDTALISAWDNTSSTPGGAYVFVREGGSWSEQTKLVPSDAVPEEGVGVSISLDGDTAVLSSVVQNWTPPYGLTSGAAWVFVRDGETWTEQAKLLPSGIAPGDRYGFSCAVDGDMAVVTADGDVENGSWWILHAGAAYVFVRDGETWTEEQKILGEFEWVGLGSDAEIDGSTVTLGAWQGSWDGWNPDQDGSGSAYVYACQPLPVALDIKPGACPNPVSTKGKGVLPVAVTGNACLDVSDIDVESLTLGGVAPLRHSIDDVTSPVQDKQGECDCIPGGPDGHDDLTLKFDKSAILAGLGDVSPGTEYVLTLTGTLEDGTAIEGSDCIVIVGR